MKILKGESELQALNREMKERAERHFSGIEAKERAEGDWSFIVGGTAGRNLSHLRDFLKGLPAYSHKLGIDGPEIGQGFPLPEALEFLARGLLGGNPAPLAKDLVQARILSLPEDEQAKVWEAFKAIPWE